MSPLVLGLFSVAQGAATGALTSYARAENWFRGAAAARVEPLSARRAAVLAALGKFVPGRYGAPGDLGARFRALAPGWSVEVLPDGSVQPSNGGRPLPKNTTTCGWLPARTIEEALGDPTGWTQYGLEQLRTVARRDGAWVPAAPGGAARPRPGDPLLYVGPDDVPLHVDLYVGKNPDGTWRIAASGQGTHAAQESKFLARVYDPAAATLSAPLPDDPAERAAALARGPAGPAPRRRLAGWGDLDRAVIHDVRGARSGVAAVLLDVRSPAEYAAGHLAGARRWTPEEDGVHGARAAAAELSGVDDWDLPCPECAAPAGARCPGPGAARGRAYVYCASGARSARAALALAAFGYDVVDLGSVRPATWEEAS